MPHDPGVKALLVVALMAHPAWADDPLFAKARAAIERGDLDEAARQGQLAGPAAVERALRGTDRMSSLAAIAAAPGCEDAAELLPALAVVARGTDRRTAIPAARAAWTIARAIAVRDPDDDIAAEQLANDRARWAAIAADGTRWIEVRVAALATVAVLAAPDLGYELAPLLADRDPDLRAAAIALIPQPTPAAARTPLAAALVHDADDRVALAAAQALCADLVADPAAPILDAIGDAGLARIKTLVTLKGSPAAIRDANRCLAAKRH